MVLLEEVISAHPIKSLTNGFVAKERKQRTL
jgi:hypothetical protein